MDIADIHKFYSSPLGRLAQKYLMRKIIDLWPDVANEIIAGYGYPLPYLDKYGSQAQQIAVLMPCCQGASPWPLGGANKVALTLDDNLPLKDNSIDRLLLVHAVEHSERPQQLLREAWRILVDGGAVMIIVPNRRGFWARNPLTPFGGGQPYSGRQLYSLVEESFFVPSKPLYALFTPPMYFKAVGALSETFELVGTSWLHKIGGVTIIQAHKQVMAPVLSCSSKAWRSRIFVPTPSPSSKKLF